ncbi:hypothetical protein Glove_9g279 [Diversispora epigaea]|uniref:Uncharacterized protein n=1 Tax=Diversispora epigaea TaxID=1348612 RepID=A0A397JYV9_9GLOM|nr:hypothetical protein Glove_9g279 [Diversispora epigaea]
MLIMKKSGQLEVVLKKFDDIVDINEDFLNEIHDVSHDKNLAFKIYTFEELEKELEKYYWDYKDNHNEITIQIKEAEEFSKNQTTADTTTTTIYQ